MEFVPVVLVLLVLAVTLGVLRDRSLAKKIGQEVSENRPADDPVVILERLHQLHQAGAVTDEEFDREKRRILGQ